MDGPQKFPVEASIPHAEAWAEMLSTVSHHHARLARTVAQQDAAIYRTRLITQLENERARLARELHSGAGQPIAGIKLNAQLLDEWFVEMPENARVALERLNTLADSAMEQIRSVSHQLHPSSWSTCTIADALRQLVEGSGIACSRQSVHLDLADLSVEPCWASRMTLYRCAQECISNAIRHSGATDFYLSVRETPGCAEMKIADNGRGIHPNEMQSLGIGLRSLREFAAAAGGEAWISSVGHNGQAHQSPGTTITIKVPLSE